jgi:hypothetical protein
MSPVSGRNAQTGKISHVRRYLFNLEVLTGGLDAVEELLGSQELRP